MSPGLKNLVSSAIGEETSPSKPTSTSPGTRVAAPTLTHLLELPLNSPGKPLPELMVAEETEVSTASSPSKTEVSTKIKESETEDEEAPPVLEKTEPVVEVEPMETTDVTTQEEVTSAVKVPEESPPEKEVAITGEPEDTTESPVKKEKEAEPIVDKEIATETTAKEEQPEVSVAFESEVEVSHSEEIEKKTEETVEEAAPILKTEPVEEEAAVNEDVDKIVEEDNEESGDEKGEEKEKQTPEVESISKSETGTPKIDRKRPQRGIRKVVLNRDADVSSDDKTKTAEPGPTTRRSAVRKGPQSDEQETESVEEPAEATPIAGVGKKKASLPPPLYVPSSSPAPSSGIDSTPNSPTSSVSTVA